MTKDSRWCTPIYVRIHALIFQQNQHTKTNKFDQCKAICLCNVCLFTFKAYDANRNANAIEIDMVH